LLQIEIVTADQSRQIDRKKKIVSPKSYRLNLF